MPRPRAATRALFEDTGSRRCGGKFNVFVCKRCGVEILENAYRFAVHLSVCKKATEDDRRLAQQQLSKSKKAAVGASPRSSVPGDVDIFGNGDRGAGGGASLKPEESYGINHRNSDFTGYGGNRAKMSDPRRASRGLGLANIGELDEDLWGPTNAEPIGLNETSQTLKEASLKLKQYRNSYDDQYNGTMFDLPFQNGKRRTPGDIDQMWGMMNGMDAHAPYGLQQAEMMLDQGMRNAAPAPRPVQSEPSPFDFMLQHMAANQWSGQGQSDMRLNPVKNNFYFHNAGYSEPNDYPPRQGDWGGRPHMPGTSQGDWGGRPPMPTTSQGDWGQPMPSNGPPPNDWPITHPPPAPSTYDAAELLCYSDLPAVDGADADNHNQICGKTHQMGMQAGGLCL